MKIRYLAILVAIAFLLLAAGCGKKAPVAAPETAPAPAPVTAPVEQPVAPAEETVAEGELSESDKMAQAKTLETGADVTEVADEVKSTKGLAADLTVESEAFPMASCDLKELDGKNVRVLTVSIKNVETDDWVIYGKVNPKGNVRVGNRGVIDITPGCEKMTLAAGEETTCNTLDNGAVISGENRVTVNTPAKQYARIVNCP